MKKIKVVQVDSSKKGSARFRDEADVTDDAYVEGARRGAVRHQERQAAEKLDATQDKTTPALGSKKGGARFRDEAEATDEAYSEGARRTRIAFEERARAERQVAEQPETATKAKTKS